MGYRVFIQIPDTAFERSLGEQLSAKGYFLSEQAENADLLLLDAALDLPEACAEHRRSGRTQPILVLGLQPSAARAAGANDGIAKPFRFNELLRCLEQVSVKAAIAVGHFRLDANAREMVDGNGRSLRLTEKETQILIYLARAGAQAVGRDELLGEVWGYAGSATTHTVETHIYRLRRKLIENGGGELLITEAGGYRLAPSN
jgi:DNA-binding response OmpR family regulator